MTERAVLGLLRDKTQLYQFANDPDLKRILWESVFEVTRQRWAEERDSLRRCCGGVFLPRWRPPPPVFSTSPSELAHVGWWRGVAYSPRPHFACPQETLKGGVVTPSPAPRKARRREAGGACSTEAGSSSREGQNSGGSGKPVMQANPAGEDQRLRECQIFWGVSDFLCIRPTHSYGHSALEHDRQVVQGGGPVLNGPGPAL